MKKIKQYITMFVLIFLILGLVTAKPCMAASAQVSVGADSTQVSVGDTFFVYLYINSATEFGNFEANLIYDEDIMEYQNGASVITGDSGFLRISDMNVLVGDTAKKYTLEFKALKAGYCDINFSGKTIIYDFSNGDEMSVSKTGMTINVKAPETASTNADLKSLKISPSDLTPVFDPKVYEYSTNVDYNTEKLIITAIPQDLKSTVSIKGNDLLKEGENKVIVSVLAESGNVIEYTINATREVAPSENNSGDATVTPAATPNSFELVEIDGVKYAIYSGKYAILEPDSSVEIPEGYEEGTIILSGISVTAYVPIDNGESEFVLLYAMNEQQETGFYQYDRVEKTLQRYVPDSMIINQNGKVSEDESKLTKEYNTKLAKVAALVALLAAFSTLLTVVVVRIILKKKGQK